MPNIINCLSFSLWLIATITCSTFAQAGDLYLIELLDEDSDDEDGFEPILSVAEKLTNVVEKNFCDISVQAQKIQSSTTTSGHFMASIIQHIRHTSNIMMAVEELDSPWKELFPSLAIGVNFRGVIDGKDDNWTVKNFRHWSCLASKFKLHQHLCGSKPTFGDNFMSVEDFNVTGAQFRIFALEKNHELMGKNAKIKDSDGVIRYVTRRTLSSPRLIVLELEDGRFILEALQKANVKD